MNNRILVVEDEAIVSRDLQFTLEEMGFVVVDTVRSGEEALRSAGEHKPDLVLMDIVLDGAIDGIDAAGQIVERLDIPVVYLTAYSDREKIDRAKLTEPFGYILKPFTNREVAVNIELALCNHARKKELESKLNEYERMNKVLLDREFNIKQLKTENEDLKSRVKDMEGGR